MTFFERLQGGRVEPRGLAAIIEQLANVLNTARGFGAVRRELGVGDCVAVVDWTRRRLEPVWGVKALCAEIVECIRLFEPDLERPAVEVRGRDLRGRVVLDVEGALDGRPARLRVTFDPESRAVDVSEERA